MNKNLVLRNISYKFGQNVVLANLNLNIKPGSIHTLIGTTGAGKSLILRLISKLLVLQAGTIETNCERISFVFQSNSFFSWLSIEKNIELSTNLKIKDIQHLLYRFKLQDYIKMYPKHLSGGTSQKFNLLRAFLNRSDIILLDEPFTHLDIIQREDLYNFMLELWAEYKPTILLVTHDIDEALFLSHEISFLSKKEKSITHTLLTENENTSNSTKNFLQHRFNNSYLENFQVLHKFLHEDAK